MLAGNARRCVCSMLAVLFPALGALAADPEAPTGCEAPGWAASRDYCNHSLPIGARVEDLLGQLTMAEKTTQVLESGGQVPRLGIPTLGSGECLRGFLSMFPQALSLSQSWNKTLVHAVASATSDEVRASANAAQKGGGGGSLACFDPVINVCRHPLWGRCQEGYGEDPWLTALLGEQYVSGLQCERPLPAC